MASPVAASKSTPPPAAESAPAPAPAAASAAPAAAGSGDDELALGTASTGPVVDMDVFGQLLEIDDDDTHEFSKMLAFDYISQAETTFDEIETDLSNGDLDALSRKGHFLKGSSAALGLQRVQHSCEAMQHFGNKLDHKGNAPEVSEEIALERCRQLLVRLRKEQDEAKAWLVEFYHESPEN